MGKLSTFVILCLITNFAFAEKLEEGDSFPTTVKGIKLTDLKSKKEVKLNSLLKKNKIVVFDFWASWCAPCKEAMPALDKLVKKYKGKVVVVGVNVDEVAQERDAFLKQHKVGFQLLFDEGQKFVKQVGVQTMPTSFVVDKTGKIQLVHKGFRVGDETKYEDAIKKSLK